MGEDEGAVEGEGEKSELVEVGSERRESVSPVAGVAKVKLNSLSFRLLLFDDSSEYELARNPLHLVAGSSGVRRLGREDVVDDTAEIALHLPLKGFPGFDLPLTILPGSKRAPPDRGEGEQGEEDADALEVALSEMAPVAVASCSSVLWWWWLARKGT